MKVSELIRAMSEAGAPMEAILIAVQAIEAGQDAIEARRSADRERKRRQRAASSDETVTVTGQSQDIPGTVTVTAPLSPSPNENNLTPTPIPPEKQTPRARKGHRLPVDWQPKPLPAELDATVGQWPQPTADKPGALERELSRFRDWAAGANGPNALKQDWDATWRNWLRKVDDEGRYRTNGTGQNHSRSIDRRDGVARALDRRLGLDDTAGPFGRPDAGEGPSLRSLPPPRAAALR